jgi:cytochrome c
MMFRHGLKLMFAALLLTACGVDPNATPTPRVRDVGVVFKPTAVSPTAIPATAIPPTATQAAPQPEALTLSGDPKHGEDIFRHGINDAPACANCHSTNPKNKGMGFALAPNLSGLAERAGSRVEGEDAKQYVYQSITDPTAFVVSGYQPIMYGGFGKKMSQQDIADLMAFVLSLP